MAQAAMTVALTVRLVEFVAATAGMTIRHAMIIAARRRAAGCLHPGGKGAVLADVGYGMCKYLRR